MKQEPDYEQIWERCEPFRIWQKKEEYIQLLKLMQEKGVTSVLEIGFHEGGTAYGFLQMGCLVYSLDINKKNGNAAILEREFPDKFRFTEGDSTNSSTVESFEALFSSGVDMVFIDGDHSFKGCEADYENYAHLARKLIVFHDIIESKLHTEQRCEVSKVWNFAKESLEGSGDVWVEFESSPKTWGGIGVIIL